jgi:hypothetical protein
MLRVIKGKINKGMNIKKGEVQTSSLNSFDRTVNNDWFIGGLSQAQAYMYMKYTPENLNIACHVFDENLNHYSTMNCDGIQLMINRKTGTDESQYRITINIDGEVKLEKLNGGKGYDNIDISVTSEIGLEGTLGNNDDTDTGYTTKTAIPWPLIGGIPQKDEVTRVHLIQKNNDRSTSILPATSESMPGESVTDPLTWLKVSFEGITGSGIYNNEKVKIQVYQSAKGILSISGDSDLLASIKKIKIYNIEGTLVKDIAYNVGNEIEINNLSTGIYVISLFTDSDKIITEKVLVY